MSENLAKREALILEIEAVLPIANLDEARRKFRDLQSKWSKIGMTERNKRAAFDKRFEIVETAIKEAEAEKWRKSDPTSKARANDVVSQLSAAVANYEAQAIKAEAVGNAKKQASFVKQLLRAELGYQKLKKVYPNSLINY